MKIIKYEDLEYPEKLRNIYNSPKQLYIEGNIGLLNSFSLAIIGCRNSSEHGREFTELISYDLALNNITIVSGLARGIDSCAHIGTIKAKGKTIAVLGGGFNHIYPKENIPLIKKILEAGGTVISEYDPNTSPKPEYFRARNRIISGLSNGVIVVEAKKFSGTMITVNYALEQGKDIYAVPGFPTMPNSEGTNELIKEGAYPLTSAKDILDKI